MNDVAIAFEAPLQLDSRRLIEALDAFLVPLYPPASNHLLPIDAMAVAGVRIAIARDDEGAIGCGALRTDPTGYGELKRIFVLPQGRGRRVGQRLLEFLAAEARRQGLCCLRLETGVLQPEAIRLFESAGFSPRAPFGDYQADPHSLFFEKRLG